MEAHSLQAVGLNGARGRVRGARGERVVIYFPVPIGEKALKPANLKLVPFGSNMRPDDGSRSLAEREAAKKWNSVGWQLRGEVEVWFISIKKEY